MARILIADIAEGVANLERILTPGHELVSVDKMMAALEALKKEIYDLIIVGVHFDDSQMFELLPQIEKIENCADKPVICFCARDTAMTRIMHESLAISARALGAWMYIDQHYYNVHKDPDAEIKRIIDRCLTDEARKGTLAKRLDIHLQREEIQRLRLALESEEWSIDLEDRLGDLRRRLSIVLRELYQAQLNSDTQHEVIKTSRNLKDRVSNHVTVSENDMTGKERNQWRKETEQAVTEQEIGEREEIKGKEGRHRGDDQPPR